MPQYEFTGTVKKVLPVFTAPSGFTKREVIVTSEGERFPQDIVFEFVKERIDLLEPIREADRVKITFDLRSREYKERHYLSASGWRIEKLDAAPSSAAPRDGDDSMDPTNLDDRMPF